MPLHVCTGLPVGTVDLQTLVNRFDAGFGDVLVDNGDFQPRNQEAGLSHTVDQLLVAEFRGVVENLRIGPIADARTGGFRADLADDLQFGRTVLPRLLEW